MATEIKKVDLTDNRVKVGDIGVLMETFNDSRPRKEWYSFHPHAAITCKKNMSGEWHPNDWLGSTDNVNSSTKGVFRVVSVKPLKAPKTHRVFPGQVIGATVELAEVDEDTWNKFVELNETHPTGGGDYWEQYRILCAMPENQQILSAID